MTLYKIVKEDVRTFHTSYSHGSYSTDSFILVKTVYKAKRKGKIFGFWHYIGNEYDDFSIRPIPFSSEDKNDVIKYIENYHLYNYNNLKYRIIKW